MTRLCRRTGRQLGGRLLLRATTLRYRRLHQNLRIRDAAHVDRLATVLAACESSFRGAAAPYLNAADADIHAEGADA
jgi:hypothetical protein